MRRIARKPLKVLTALILLNLSALSGAAQGIPFIRNFHAEEYHANNTNFDIETDENGNVFVANFEGLMYYDYAEWHIIHTPGIARVTVVYRAEDNNIWVGGYNYFGKIVRKANGEITLKRIAKEDLFRGEVSEIFETNGELQFLVSNGVVYKVKNDKVSISKTITSNSLKLGMLDVVDVDAIESKNLKDLVKDEEIMEEDLGDGINVKVIKNSGILITDAKQKTRFTVTDENGLCSNNVVYGVYDGRGHFWGSTGKGVFVLNIPATITRFTSNEGLHGTVLSIEEIGGKIYAGTDDGLYRQEGYRFVRVPQLIHACWNLKKSGNELLAATADGIYRVNANGAVRQLSTTASMAILDEGSHIYSGEISGLYLINADGSGRKKACGLENVTKIVKDDEGTIWAQSLYGGIWYKKAGNTHFEMYKSGEKSETVLTVVPTSGRATVVSSTATAPFPYPLISYTDNEGVTWLTDNEGKAIYQWKDGKRLTKLDKLLFPLHNQPIRTIYTRKNEIWLGCDNGLIIVNTEANDPNLNRKPNLYIRTVKLDGDSILWGGFGKMPERLAELEYKENNLTFTFSLDYPTISGETLYRYRLNNGSWSTWSTSTSASFVNLNYGDYTFSVQARDISNRTSDITQIKFLINPPFYHRWYMYVLYFLLMLLIFYALFRLRLQRLEKDKIRLEKLVQDRTAEVVRLEKMATAGKLTQGLIDRILNPLNYINNFSKLSEGLIKDVKANIEDEKENMDEENYEDTLDVLDMLTGNLQKVSEHGQNTTRTLKAMEELLKDRSGGIVPMDFTAVIKQDEKMLHEYYKKEIDEQKIKVVFDYPDEQIQIDGNPEQLSKTIMSLLANAIYAVSKKAAKTSFTPEISLKVTKAGDGVTVSVHDNGIGIEETILDKLFDPFFTTKTTSEAAGVGLYLSREIVQNHGGDIIVKSVKDEYSEFTFTLPYKKS